MKVAEEVKENEERNGLTRRGTNEEHEGTKIATH